MFRQLIQSMKYSFLLYAAWVMILLLLVWLYQLPVQMWLDASALSSVVLAALTIRRYGHLRRADNALAAGITNPEDYLGVQEPVVNAWNACQQQLKDCQLKLDETRQDYTNWFSLWTHQIKLPLTVISLRTENDPATQIQLKRVQRYVDMVMAYARLGNDIIPSDVNVTACCRQAIRSFSTECIHKKLHLETHLEEVTILSDAKWLELVLEQILSNAIKYTPASGTIAVNLTPEKLEISDTGIGIAASDLPSIFERGYTGANGHDTETSSGIGLYLVRQILDMLHLRIEIQSVQGTGTTVTIPLHQEIIEHDDFERMAPLL